MLRDEAMIVRLSICQWAARKLDKKVTSKVAADYGVDSEVGKYSKMLIAEDALKAIAQAATEARTFHYEQTLPWDDVGGRLLPAENFMDYSKRMRELKEVFETKVREFINNYDDYRDAARKRLRGMFNISEYPDSYQIARKYGFATEITPIPSKEDFRVNVQSKDAARIRKEIEAMVNDRAQKAMADLYVRLADTVGHFAEKMADKDAIFRDSLVENLVDLVNLLPKLNVTHDAMLEKLGAEAKAKLCAYEPDTLRGDAKVRKDAADKAAALLKKMSGYTGQQTAA
jgi:uncharacterized protein YukE